VPHLKVSGKGGKTRYLPLHPGTNGLINDYLEAAGHGADEGGALFRPIRNNRTGKLERAITADGVYRLVRAYSAQLGFEIGAHALRATAATNALDHQADIAKVQEWAWPRQHRHDAHLRSPPDAAGGQPDVQGHILTRRFTTCTSGPLD
jgi:integrase